MGLRAGRLCSANINTGTYSTPVWAALTRISNVKRGQSRGTTQRKYRGAKNAKNVQGMRVYTFSFTYVARDAGETDANFVLLQASFDNETLMDLSFLDKAAGTGAKGVRGPFVVTKLDRNEDDEDAVSYDVEVSEIDADQTGVLWEVDNFTMP